MIQPREEVPGEFGHPVWKRNAFAGLITCIIGIMLMISVALFIYGAIIFALGAAWTVIACLVGSMQEHGDMQRHTPA
jgi:hypothetical protein